MNPPHRTGTPTGETLTDRTGTPVRRTDAPADPARTDPAPTAPLPSTAQVREALYARTQIAPYLTAQDPPGRSVDEALSGDQAALGGDVARALGGVGTYGTGGQPLNRSINRPIADRPRTPPPVDVADRRGAAHQTPEGPTVAALEAASRTRKAKRLRHEHRMDVYAEIRSALIILLLIVMVFILASTGVQVFGILAGWWALPWARGQ